MAGVPEWTEPELRTQFENFMWTFNRFERLRVPTDAAVQGMRFGGGFELAIRSDVIFAGQSAKFARPEQSIGIVTLLGDVYRVAERAGRSRAMEWDLTSEQVRADEMECCGVINRVVPDSELDDAATAFARTVAEGPTAGSRGPQGACTRLGGWRSRGSRRGHDRHRLATFPDRRLAAIPAAVKALQAGRPRLPGHSRAGERNF
ncbi:MULTISPECIES: enoyl-CoA hydratase/isomerase family protein [unclassified Rhodococcus (in: high G+C Gram-positive bacteria)]|uniref:enoyl-CoA hydratase/isomerase family protein n=1 Tax=unclassified Rhodococcus (in: high G+C Gram-positive bacteria) TaxID=192944 RepID=UPI00289DEA7F|nr:MULTISPECIES: enoyl-CoA hydratase/isomerase family protein [unclassified Rhodococcus (in: high G+C Gram-positive bacteria)]